MSGQIRLNIVEDIGICKSSTDPTSENIISEGNWLSPWELMEDRQIGLKQQQFLNILSNYLNAQLNGKEILANNILAEYKEALAPYKSIFDINHSL